MMLRRSAVGVEEEEEMKMEGGKGERRMKKKYRRRRSRRTIKVNGPEETCQRQRMARDTLAMSTFYK